MSRRTFGSEQGMVILVHTEGRFGHQLSQYVTLLAYAVRYNCRFFYPAFHRKYGSLFRTAGLQAYDPGRTGSREVILRMVFRLLRLFFNGKVKLGKALFYLYPKADKRVVFHQTLDELFNSGSGWVYTDRMFNDIPALIRYRNEIRSLLQFREDLEMQVGRLTSQLRKEYDYIVCVHIRKGDFRYFEGGRFFYEEEVYVGLLKRFLELAQAAGLGRPAVVVCSDEKIRAEVFEGLPVFLGPRPFEEDFILMRSSDYIIASRSIFSTMANYLSDNRMYQFADPAGDFTLDDFVTSETLLRDRYDYNALPEEVPEFRMQRFIVFRKLLALLNRLRETVGLAK